MFQISYHLARYESPGLGGLPMTFSQELQEVSMDLSEALGVTWAEQLVVQALEDLGILYMFFYYLCIYIIYVYIIISCVYNSYHMYIADSF